jgi:hypothetical protein
MLEITGDLICIRQILDRYSNSCRSMPSFSTCSPIDFTALDNVVEVDP